MSLYQKIHLYRVNLIVCLAHILLLAYAIYYPVYTVITLLIGWVVHNFTHSLYIHRVRAHRHHVWSPRMHTVGLTLFSMLNLGSPAVYVAVHANHHIHSDTAKDPHCPHHVGIWRAMLSLWTESFMPHKKTLASQLRDPKVKWFHKHHLKFALLTAIALPAFTVVAYYLSKIPIILVHLNGLGYAIESDDPTTSKNVTWLKPICWGEELHNNHHLHPRTANHNIENSWREFDGIYYIGKFFEVKT